MKKLLMITLLTVSTSVSTTVFGGEKSEVTIIPTLGENSILERMTFSIKNTETNILNVSTSRSVKRLLLDNGKYKVCVENKRYYGCGSFYVKANRTVIVTIEEKKEK